MKTQSRKRTMIPAVFDRWLEHDPAVLAASLPPSNRPAIYFDCGTLDDFVLHNSTIFMDVRLKQTVEVRTVELDS